jgi:ribosomal protein L16 Arg81 hydroxylase
MLIEHLIHGGVEDLETFMRDVWQKRILLIPHQDPAWLHNVFQLYDVEELWYSAMQAPHATVNNGGLLVFPRAGVKAERPLNPFFAFASRCSVVVNRGDRFCTRLYQLCRQLETEAPNFPMACCNVYLTPPGTQTVPKHSNDRDVLLLQVFGEKEWTVYNAPTVLPYREEELGKVTPVDDALLSSKSVFRVRQGDVLYMPRGFVHEARTLPTTSSLHITVALQTSDWDYGSQILRTLENVLRSPEFQHSRQCIPLNALSGESASAGVEAGKYMQGLVTALMTHKSLQTFDHAKCLFGEHLAAMHQERDATVRETAVVIPAPLLLSSLIMWNPTIDLDGIEEIKEEDQNVPLLKYRVHCSRTVTQSRSSNAKKDVVPGSIDRMTFGATDETLRAVRWLTKQPPSTPLQVRQLPMFDDLGKVALAIVLINNMSCVRVS